VVRFAARQKPTKARLSRLTVDIQHGEARTIASGATTRNAVAVLGPRNHLSKRLNRVPKRASPKKSIDFFDKDILRFCELAELAHVEVRALPDHGISRDRGALNWSRMG